jgi:hypothetical protein
MRWDRARGLMRGRPPGRKSAQRLNLPEWPLDQRVERGIIANYTASGGLKVVVLCLVRR